jgi:thioredoxin-related protein
MKKRVVWISVLALFGILGINAQEKVKWYSIEEAIQLTAQEPRVLVIDVYTDWCGWCKRMDATTFSDPTIAAMLNRHFYPVKLDAEGKEDIMIGNRTFKYVESGRSGYHEVAAIVTKGRLSYPTISYVDDQGKVIDAYAGYKTPEQLKVYLDYFAEGNYKTKSFEEFSASAQE